MSLHTGKGDGVSGLRMVPSTFPNVDKATPELLQQMLQEENERQSRWNLAICCIVLFCAEASRGLFIPSLWSCVQHIGMDHSFLSWCIPIFSIGRMFGSYAAGSMSDRWNDDGLPTVACLLASIAGGIIYVLADMNRSWMLLLLAEFGMGLGGGTLAVLRAHVSKITTDKLRMSHTTYISTAQFAGLGLMPLAALAINYYFVGPEHHEEHALALASDALVAGASGLLADQAADHFFSAKHEQNEFGQQHGSAAGGHTRNPSAGGGTQRIHPSRRSYHSGLENSSHRFPKSEFHAAKNPASLAVSAGGAHAGAAAAGGRHLLETATTTTVSSMALNALSAVGPETIHPEELKEGFLKRLINHRTAPAHLLVILNLGCLLLYFMYFNSQHESSEYTTKKASDKAKKALADKVRKAAKEKGGEFDVDNEEAGPSGAFEKGTEKDPTSPAAGSSGSHTGGRGRNKPVKEIVFDVSKLEGLTLLTTAAAATGGESKADESTVPASSISSTTPAIDLSEVSIVQVRDTTVITLAPFGQTDEPTTKDASSSSNAVARKKVQTSSNASSPIADSEDLELSSSRGKSRTAKGFSLSTFAHALVGLFSSTKPVGVSGSVNASNTAGSVHSSSSSTAPGGLTNTSSQRARIAAYEKGSAHVDLDNEGIMLGGLRLTPERMVLWGSCLFVYLNYTIRGVLATVETVGTPTLAKFQGIPPGSPLEVECSAKFFGVLGLLGCVVFFLQWYYQDYIDEPTSLIAGFVVTVTGSTAILMFQNSENGFVFGCVCIWSFGLPAVQNSVLAALSRILGTRPQGTWMGWIQTFGSLGRVTFPLITKVFSVSFAFFLSSMGCGIAIVALLIYMKLVKMTM